MPIYEYACTACGERTEEKQSFDDPPLEDCPVCGGKLRKLYSPVGIVFKGSGFYSTDAKKGSGSRAGSGGSESTGSKGGSKTDGGSSSSSESSGSSDKSSSSTGSSGSGSSGDATTGSKGTDS